MIIPMWSLHFVFVSCYIWIRKIKIHHYSKFAFVLFKSPNFIFVLVQCVEVNSNLFFYFVFPVFWICSFGTLHFLRQSHVLMKPTNDSKIISKMRSTYLLVCEIVKNRKLLCYDDTLPLVDSGGGGNEVSDGIIPSRNRPVIRRHTIIARKRINRRFSDFHYFFRFIPLESFSSAGLISSLPLS